LVVVTSSLPSAAVSEPATFKSLSDTRGDQHGHGEQDWHWRWWCRGDGLVVVWSPGIRLRAGHMDLLIDQSAIVRVGQCILEQVDCCCMLR
jgi:hypothetical protein